MEEDLQNKLQAKATDIRHKTDIATYRINRARERFIEEKNEEEKN